MNQAKTLAAIAAVAACSAWPVAAFAQAGAGNSGYGTAPGTGSSGASAGSSSNGARRLDQTTGQAGAWSGASLVGPYIGGSLGQSNYSSDSCFGECDKTDFGGKVFGGYMFTPWLGAELDYGWFGTLKIKTSRLVGGTLVSSEGEVKTDGFSGFLVGQFPIDNFRVFGKLGFARLNTSVSGSVNGIQLVDNNDPSFEFAWGLGGTYMFDRNLGVRAEYEARKYKFEGDKNTLGFWSVGVQYHF